MIKFFLVFSMTLFTSLMASQLQWADDLKSGIAQATKQNKPILFIYSSHNCQYCVQLEEQALSDQKVIESLNKDFVSVIAYADEQDYVPQELWRPGTPTIWFLDPSGRSLIKDPIMGAIDPESFGKILDVVTREFEAVMEARK